MNGAITVELRFFLISILWGVIILLVYDGLRILRRLIPHNSFFLALEDLIFWVLTSLFIFAMIYTMNNGTIRGFSVMGMAIGMILYHYIFSEFVVKWVTKAILLLLSPIRFAIDKIRKLLTFVLSKLKRIINYFQNRLKKYAKSVKITYSKVNHKRKSKQAIRKEKRIAKTVRHKEKRSQKSNLRKVKKEEKHIHNKKFNKTDEQKKTQDTEAGIYQGQQGIVMGKRQGRQGAIPIRKRG